MRKPSPSFQKFTESRFCLMTKQVRKSELSPLSKSLPSVAKEKRSPTNRKPLEYANPPQAETRRQIVITDFGAYLKRLRIDKNITLTKLSKEIGYAPEVISKIEKSTRLPPPEHRLALWLSALGESKRLPEALRLLRSVKRSHRVFYFANDPINEHIDRILTAYANHRLNTMDKDLLSMVALGEYVRGDIVDPYIHDPNPRNPEMAKNSAKNTAAAQLGSKGGVKGGPARAKTLTSLERSSIASKGGKAKSTAIQKKSR